MSSAESLSRKWADLFAIMVLLGQLEEISAIGQTVNRCWETMVVCPTFSCPGMWYYQSQMWSPAIRAPKKDLKKWVTHLFRLVPAVLLPLEDCCCEELVALCCEWCSGWNFLTGAFIAKWSTARACDGFTPSLNHIRIVNNLSLFHERSWRLSSWALQYLQCHTTKDWLVALSLSTEGLTTIHRYKGSHHGCAARRGIGISLTYRLTLML